MMKRIAVALGMAAVASGVQLEKQSMRKVATMTTGDAGDAQAATEVVTALAPIGANEKCMKAQGGVTKCGTPTDADKLADYYMCYFSLFSDGAKSPYAQKTGVAAADLDSCKTYTNEKLAQDVKDKMAKLKKDFGGGGSATSPKPNGASGSAANGALAAALAASLLMV